MSHTKKMDVLRGKLEQRAEDAERKSHNPRRFDHQVMQREGETFRTAIDILDEVARY